MAQYTAKGKGEAEHVRQMTELVCVTRPVPEIADQVVALGFELQRPSVGHELGHLGHPIDRVYRPLLSVCLGHRKDLALTKKDCAQFCAHWSTFSPLPIAATGL